MRQDAHEKAFEIQVLGQRIFEHERDSQVEAQSRLLEKEFHTKHSNLHVEAKIAVSTKTNEVRLHRMTFRDKHLGYLREKTMEALIEKMQNDADSYRAVLKDLIVQGMIKMLEENVEILVKEGDEDLVNELIPECEETYAALMLEKTEREYTTKLSVVEGSNLTKEQGSDVGGVVLLAHNRRIVVPNTLKDRLNLVFDLELPLIRKLLFPPAQ